MRKIKVLGGEPQLAMILVLVCGPVLLGLWLILFGSIRETGGALWGIATHPADSPWPILLILIWANLLVANSDPAFGEDGEPKPRERHPTDWLWFAAVGVMVGLTAARNEIDTPAGNERNIAAYAAMAAATLHFFFVWKRPSEELLFNIARAVLALCFIGWLLHIWLVQGEGGRALFFGIAMVGIYGVTRLIERNADEVDYRRRR